MPRSTAIPMSRAALAAAVLLAACQQAPASAPIPTAGPAVAVTSISTALHPSACSGQFVPHTLGFATGMRIRELSTYISNGAGVAANDLDSDGDTDLVFASIDGPSSILWNQGGLSFTEQTLGDELTRGVNTVDVDGDGLLDLVFTHTSTASLSFWRNTGAQGDARFVNEPLVGLESFAYSMAWGDLNGDTTLDVVTGAYDADLSGRGVDAETRAAHGGVSMHIQQDGQFTTEQLTNRAETLALGLVDLDGDGRRDIWAANDFAVPDGFWSPAGGWHAMQPFRQTSHSTMSIDWGDIGNNGQQALFTTDMNPGDLSPHILAEWLPVISKLEEKHGPNDPQVMANMLQIGGAGNWQNLAPQQGVDATGWSWSGKFGDLDNDGLLDLYVVNGMIAENLFPHLANAELVEQNRAFRNLRGRFQAMPGWNLGSTASGRGMLMADMDGDGDLDIVVNNVRGSAQLFENQLCGGDGLLVDLRWPESANTHAIGAELELHTSAGILQRDVRASSGYLSGDASQVHFGFPSGTTLEELRIRYPDGTTARIPAPAAQTRLEVSR